MHWTETEHGLSRRNFLSGALAAGTLPLLPASAFAAPGASSLYAASRREADGSFAAVLFSAEGDCARLAACRTRP